LFCAKPAAVVSEVTMLAISSPEPTPVEEMTEPKLLVLCD